MLYTLTIKTRDGRDMTTGPVFDNLPDVLHDFKALDKMFPKRVHIFKRAYNQRWQIITMPFAT